jgi:hypothetical protein
MFLSIELQVFSDKSTINKNPLKRSEAASGKNKTRNALSSRN